MKRIVFIFSLFCICLSYGQSNSWINHSQKYYRIPITAEGVYKVTYADLVANGISVGDFDHRNLQIIHDGKVLPLFVSAQSDGIFRATDYFEFYAEGGNTGWLDAEVYSTGKPINEAYSLYNDTASYFLTFANTLESPRYDTARSTNYENYSPIPYWLRTVRENYTTTFNATNSSPYILPSEGWTDAYFDMGKSVQKILSTPNFASVNVPTTVSFGVAGFSETQHDVRVSLSSDASVRFDTTYYKYNAVHKTLATSNPLENVTTVTFQSLDGDKAADKNAVSYVEITYPSKLNCSNQMFFRFTVPQVKSTADYILLDIANFNAGTAAPIVYCPELGKRILATKVNGVYKVLLPNVGRELKCVVVSQRYFLKVPEIKSVQTKNTKGPNFVDFSLEQNQGDYIIITEKSLWSQANAYRMYREQTGQKVVLVDVEELYSQFAYGVWKHPYAIKGFIDYALKNWSVKPEYVFLIGKGFHTNEYRNNMTRYARTLVPSMGIPASDLLYTVDSRGRSIRTDLAIGRLAAETSNEVAIYRKKVMDFEAQEPSPWMKNVLHFGGGSTAYEQTTFRHYLGQYARMLKGMYFGADVHSFFKESSDVYETTEPEAIRKYMNEGTSLMTFFGHASGSGFDQNVDHPSRFDNQGRYPLVLANSCYSGDIFADNDYNVSQIWVLAENRGAIGFLANAGSGYASYLNIFSSAFVRNLSSTMYGKPIGACIAKTLTDLSSRVLIYEDLYDRVLGFMLNGDPKVALHSFDRPDFVLDASSVFLSPDVITSDVETVTLNVAIKNNGRAYDSDFGLKAVFTPEKGDSFEFDTIVYGSYCRDTVSYSFPSEKLKSGEWAVTVQLDYLDEIQELSEENNSAQYTFFVSSQEVFPVWPLEFSIIPTDTVTLQMSSADAFNVPKEIIVEIDTTAAFDSELKISQIVKTEEKSLVAWKPDMQFEDSTTYFWRVSAMDSLKWNVSSFTYEQGKNGWAQIHRNQFSQNTLTHLLYDDTTKQYSFVSMPHEILLQTRGNCTTEKEYLECLFVKDVTLMENSGFPLSSPALHVIVLDQTTLDPWMSNKASYGQRNYPQANGRVRNHLAFTSNNAASQRALAKFLLETVPDGNHILCYSFKNPYCQSWDASLKDAMDSLGFSAYKTAPDNYPYIFYVQKGDKQSCEEVVGTSPTDLIRYTKTLNANYDDGLIYSPIIGPAKSFDKVVWDATLADKDVSYLTVSCLSNDDNSYTVKNLFSPEWGGLDTLINTTYYPRMKMNCYMQDPSRTPIDLNYWKVYFDPSMELAVTPEYAYSLSANTLMRGDSLQIVVSAKNITAAKSDSVLVMYEVRNSQNEIVFLQYNRISPADAYSYVIDTQSIATHTFAGKYLAKVEFNPVNPETGEYDLPESIHFNNVYHFSFFVETDKTAPVLDVLFDGRHLMNGDIVSPTPEILISLYDENPFFSVADTSLYLVSVVNIESGDETFYHFSDGALSIQSIATDKNVCRILFSPEFTEDGQYELRVQARDVSGNYAATQDYAVQFEIVHEQAISLLYNYPNPCNGTTTFRVVVTGTEAPHEAKILISDAKGCVVKTLVLKSLHIGTNNIDMYWDGRNQAGIALPNGVYFYRFSFADSDEWKHLPTKQTQAINKRCGRLLLQR